MYLLLNHYIYRMKTKVNILLVFLLLTAGGEMYAQYTSQPVSSHDILKEMDVIYGTDQRLASGPLYSNPPTGSVSGHPYYTDKEWKNGKVVLDGIVYDSLLLKYDIEKDELVLNTINLNSKALQVCLKTGSVTEFQLGDKYFVKHPGWKKPGKKVFYELAAGGEIDYLLLKSKEMQMTNTGINDFEYKEYIKSYLLKDGEMVRFRTKRSLFRLVPEYKDDLKKFISRETLFPGRKNLTDRARLINYYNSLISESR